MPERESGYREYLPSPGLRPFVACFWTSVPSPYPSAHRVLPDGCLDLILDLDSTELSVVGAMTRPLLVPSRDARRYLGVRLRPGQARLLLSAPANELTDLRVPVDELWCSTPAVDALTESAPLSRHVQLLEQLIAHRIETARPTSRLVDVAVQLIIAAHGNIAIDSVGARLGVTRQHLGRLFATDVGVSPKVFARVMRLQHVLSLTRGATEVDWSSVALDAAYFDQSHLIAEFKELTGLTPSAWLSAS